MKNISETYGAARLGDKILAARVENDGVRRKVTAFLSASDDKINGDNLGSGRLFIGIDNRLAIVKKIQIKKRQAENSIEMARFELTQSLLETPDHFYLDTLPVNEKQGYDHYITIAYHREAIDRLINMFQQKLRKPSGFKLDAVALANGYNTFCRNDPGELQVLIDLETDMVIMVLLHRSKLYGITRLEIKPGEEISSETAGKLASELKLVLSYHLSELFQDGITVPLSRIILSGKHARNELVKSALKYSFSTEITLPRFHEGYFQPAENTIDRYRPERFLIPLGLAVE